MNPRRYTWSQFFFLARSPWHNSIKITKFYFLTCLLKVRRIEQNPQKPSKLVCSFKYTDVFPFSYSLTISVDLYFCTKCCRAKVNGIQWRKQTCKQQLERFLLTKRRQEGKPRPVVQKVLCATKKLCIGGFRVSFSFLHNMFTLKSCFQNLLRKRDIIQPKRFITLLP